MRYSYEYLRTHFIIDVGIFLLKTFELPNLESHRNLDYANDRRRIEYFVLELSTDYYSQWVLN